MGTGDTGTLYLGNTPTGDRTFDGRLDEVAYYSYVLRPEQVRHHYGDTAKYGYDATYELTSVQYPDATTDTYTYDRNGNRLTKNSTSYTYNAADRMLTAGGTSYGYDNNGNQTSRSSDTFGWDPENRMTSTSIGGASGSYAYNGDGLRASRTLGGATTSYRWDVAAGLPQVLQDSASNTYVYGLDLVSRTDSGSSQEYYLTDGLGSTTGLTTGTGALADTYTYDVFGASRTHTGSSPNEFTFTGEQVDATGLQYLRARYYDAATGRFVSRDPLPFTQRYAYAGDNPVTRTDPSGLAEEPTPVAGISKATKHKRCAEGFVKCQTELVKEAEAKWGSRAPFPGYFGNVCAFMLLKCEQSSDGTFDFELARKQMSLGDGDEPWWSKFTRIIRGIRPPSTGSGGYLNSGAGKEGGAFGCPFWPSSGRAVW